MIIKQIWRTGLNISKPFFTCVTYKFFGKNHLADWESHLPQAFKQPFRRKLLSDHWPFLPLLNSPPQAIFVKRWPHKYFNDIKKKKKNQWHIRIVRQWSLWSTNSWSSVDMVFVHWLERARQFTGLDTYFFLNLAVGQPSNTMDLSKIEICLGMVMIFSFGICIITKENKISGRTYIYICLLVFSFQDLLCLKHAVAW